MLCSTCGSGFTREEASTGNLDFCHPTVIDDSNIYDPPELSTLGYLYHGIGQHGRGHCKVTAA